MSIRLLVIRFKRKVFPNLLTSTDMHKYLRMNGISVGNNTIFYSPGSITIDVQRPHMISIGDYCKITSGVIILAHDYSRSVLCNLPQYGNVGEAKVTTIGNNVFIGMNSIILMGSEIGNNTIVGAGSVVSGQFPDNVVICGNPAKPVCSLDEFYKKRKSQEVESANLFKRRYKEKYGKDPTVTEMTNAFSWLYLNSEDIEKYPNLFNLGGVNKELYLHSFSSHEKTYRDFNEFLYDDYSSKDEKRK